MKKTINLQKNLNWTNRKGKHPLLMHNKTQPTNNKKDNICTKNHKYTKEETINVKRKTK